MLSTIAQNLLRRSGKYFGSFSLFYYIQRSKFTSNWKRAQNVNFSHSKRLNFGKWNLKIIQAKVSSTHSSNLWSLWVRVSINFGLKRVSDLSSEQHNPTQNHNRFLYGTWYGGKHYLVSFRNANYTTRLCKIMLSRLLPKCKM